MTTEPNTIEALIKELWKGLEGVTPGFPKWLHLLGDRTVYTKDPDDGCRIAAIVRADAHTDNAALFHIARCNPANISALLDHIAALQERAEKAEAEREAAELRLKIYEEEDARINAEFVAIAETALKEAEEVIRPFADFDTEDWKDEVRLFDDDPTLNMGHLRAAQRWIAARHTKEN